MKRSRDKPTKAGAVELTEDELGKAAGGSTLKMKPCLVTSYTTSGSEGDTPDTDANLGSITPTR